MPSASVYAGRTLQSEREESRPLAMRIHGSVSPSSANPGWAVTGPVTVISQYSMLHFQTSM